MAKRAQLFLHIKYNAPYKTVPSHPLVIFNARVLWQVVINHLPYPTAAYNFTQLTVCEWQHALSPNIYGVTTHSWEGEGLEEVL